jgi:hypothetical protein
LNISTPHRPNRSYPSLLAELRRNLKDLGVTDAVILERGLLISSGDLFFAGAGEIAAWLGDDDRTTAKRCRRRLIERGHLLPEEQRRRPNGGLASLACRFSEQVLDVYRRWQKTVAEFKQQRATPANDEPLGSKCPQPAPQQRPAPAVPLGSKCPQQGESKTDLRDFKNLEGGLGADAPRVCDMTAYAGAVAANRFHGWLANLLDFARWHYGQARDWQAQTDADELIRRADNTANTRSELDRQTRRQLDAIDRIYREHQQAGWHRRRAA